MGSVPPIYPPYLPPPPTGGSVATGGGVYNPNSLGQVFANIYGPLYPCLNLSTGQLEYRTFDVTVPFNDPALGSEYFFKIEEVLPYRNPSVRSVIVTYFDMGVLTLAFTITSSDDNQTVKTQTVTKKLGNAIPTKRLLAQRIDFLTTGQLIQLSMKRAPNGGVMQIAKVVMGLDVEKSTL